MSASRCFRVEDLADVLALPTADMRQHAAECPRCRALVTAYRAFLEPGAQPAGARVDVAEPRLSAALRSEIYGAAVAGQAAPAASARPVPGRSGDLRARLRSLLTVPALRPAWALAALVVVVGTAFFALDAGRRDRGTMILRGEGPARPGVAAAPALSVPVPLSGGRVELRWSAVAGVEGYRVRLYSSALEELAAMEVRADTLLAVRPAEIPGAPAPGMVLLWRVFALRGGAEVASSTVGTLRVP